jgi:hypothetical protein
MAMFHMPHGQSFGYLYPSCINRLVGEALRSRTLGVNSRVRFAAVLEQSSSRIVMQ